MPELIGEFEWRVAKSGYRIVDGDRLNLDAPGPGVLANPWHNVLSIRRSGRFLVVDPENVAETGDSGQDATYRYNRRKGDVKKYFPSRLPIALFLQFAEISGEEVRVVEFANEYGSLGGDITSNFRPAFSIPGLGAGYPWFGEDIELWMQESSKMSMAFDLWNSVRSGDISPLERCLVLDGDTCGFVDSDRWGVRMKPICTSDYEPQRRLHVEKEGAEAGARFVIRDIISAGLSNRFNQSFEWDSEGRAMSLKVRPTSLIGALWLQCAESISVETDYARCDSCSKWFLVTPGAGRPDKKFCSDACRMRAYRERKKAREGKPVRRRSKAGS